LGPIDSRQPIGCHAVHHGPSDLGRPSWPFRSMISECYESQLSLLAAWQRSLLLAVHLSHSRTWTAIQSVRRGMRFALPPQRDSIYTPW
jgi:hypothetical protein